MAAITSDSIKPFIRYYYIVYHVLIADFSGIKYLISQVLIHDCQLLIPDAIAVNTSCGR